MVHFWIIYSNLLCVYLLGAVVRRLGVRALLSSASACIQSRLPPRRARRLDRSHVASCVLTPNRCEPRGRPPDNQTRTMCLVSGGPKPSLTLPAFQSLHRRKHTCTRTHTHKPVALLTSGHEAQAQPLHERQTPPRERPPPLR